MNQRLGPGRRVMFVVTEALPDVRGELRGRGPGKTAADHHVTLVKKVLYLIRCQHLTTLRRGRCVTLSGTFLTIRDIGAIVLNTHSTSTIGNPAKSCRSASTIFDEALRQLPAT